MQAEALLFCLWNVGGLGLMSVWNNGFLLDSAPEVCLFGEGFKYSSVGKAGASYC